MNISNNDYTDDEIAISYELLNHTDKFDISNNQLISKEKKWFDFDELINQKKPTSYTIIVKGTIKSTFDNKTLSHVEENIKIDIENDPEDGDGVLTENFETITYNIEENKDKGHKITKFNLLDSTQNPITDVKYEIKDNPSEFVIDQDGTLRTNKKFNYEDNNNNYDLIIQATGNGYSDETEININITDINDKPSQLNLNGTSILEDQGSGKEIGMFNVVDDDLSSDYKYEVNNTDFEIDQQTGMLKTGPKSNLQEGNFDINVKAIDKTDTANSIINQL